MLRAILIILAIFATEILAIATVFFAVCVAISAVRYIYGECIHVIRNAKKSTREMLWDFEWKIKRR